jgi:Ca2+-binding EF-hand superfamily protein
MQKVSRMVESALVLTALTVLAWGAATAQAAVVEAATETFKQFDVDGDGYVTAAEAVKAEIDSEAYVAADRDQDGKLSLDEFAAASAEEGETRKR